MTLEMAGVCGEDDLDIGGYYSRREPYVMHADGRDPQGSVQGMALRCKARSSHGQSHGAKHV